MPVWPRAAGQVGCPPVEPPKKEDENEEYKIRVANLQEAIKKPRKSKSALKDSLGKEPVDHVCELTKSLLSRYFIFFENEADEVEATCDMSGTC